MITTVSRIIAALACIAAPAIALERPAVPPSAKKLTGAEIVVLYTGIVGSYNNLTNDVTLTGRSWMNFNAKRLHGFYTWDKKDHGMFMGSIRIKGDNFCYKTDKDKEICVGVWQDGTTTYETDAKGVVTSQNTIASTAPPALPGGLSPATPEEFTAFSKGKVFESVPYDADAPLIAETKWDWKKKKVTGNFIRNGKEKGKFAFPVIFKDGKSCIKFPDSVTCYTVYIDGPAFYEIRDDGGVHAVSTAR
jgi:hypothetical protein